MAGISHVFLEDRVHPVDLNTNCEFNITWIINTLQLHCQLIFILHYNDKMLL